MKDFLPTSDAGIESDGVWLPRMLHWLCLGVAVGLLALVFLSPLVDNSSQDRAEGWRVVSLFAGDATLRRTAVVTAVGLAVTARVFFRSTKTTVSIES